MHVPYPHPRLTVPAPSRPLLLTMAILLMLPLLLIGQQTVRNPLNNTLALTGGAGQQPLSVVTDYPHTMVKSTIVSERIAFVSGRAPGSLRSMYVMNADGSNPQMLTNSRSPRQPTWSPDGTHIAFVGYGGPSNIYVINADGSNETNLTNANEVDEFPAWSPDGTRIAFSAFSSSDSVDHVYVINTDGSHRIRLTNNEGADPTWSPDGKHIAFVSTDNSNGGIYVIDSDGNNQQKLPDSSIHDSQPAWSPDGTRIAFTSYGSNGNRDIYVMNADGTNRVSLTNGSASETYPSWSPDGTHIAFVVNHAGNTDIYVMNAIDGSNQQQITDTPFTDEDPAWSSGSLPTQECHIVGNVKVCGKQFSGDSTNWTATGTVWIGDYTIVENASITANGNALSGSGLVSMVTSADGSQRTPLFQDSFDVDTSQQLLKPRAVNGDWRLGDIVGFHIDQPPTDVTINLAQGQIITTLNLDIVIPGNKLVKDVSVILDHTGAVSGSLENVSFDLGRVKLRVSKATLGTDGFTIGSAELVLPPGLGGPRGTRADLSVHDARITSDGKFILGSGRVMVHFPNIQVGGDNGFAIKGAQASLTITSEGAYIFSGRGTFEFPGVGPGKDSCKVGTGFTFASDPPPFRDATLSIDGCFKIPIADTGFFLTKVSGQVQLDEGNQVAVDVGIGIEGGPEIPGLDSAPVSGEPKAHWDNSWKVGLSGKLKVFKFDVADAALELSKKQGLKGEINLSLVGVIEGHGDIRISKDKSNFHFTGRENVRVQVEQGKIFQKCVLGICADVPPATIQGPEVGAYFGEFHVHNSIEYGIKGRMDILGYHPAFFVNAAGKVKFDLGGLNEYQLVGTVSLQSTSDVRQFTVAPNTPALLAELAVGSGSPSLSLITPDGQTLTATSPGVVATTTATQTLLTVANPTPGGWKISIDNLNGGEQYAVVALGARPEATVASPTITSSIATTTIASNTDGSYSIGLVASSATPTSTISLFYDTSDISHTGIPIVQGLPLTTTSYNWQPTTVPSGIYHIYAMVDDPLGVPAFAYSPTPVTINDITPPDTPTGLSVSGNGSNATISWQPSTAPDAAGYRVYYREPGGGTTFVEDIPSAYQTTYTQEGLYLNGGWDLTVSAYDLSGNESAQSGTVQVQINPNGGSIYLPIVIR